MSNNYTCCIDKERLNGSIETLDCIENCLTTRNLSNDFIDIEEIIKNTNFYHNNCIRNYKDKIDYIIDEIENVRKEVSKLNSILNKTIKEFSQAEELKTNDVENIFEDFHCKVDVSNLSINNNLKVANNTSLFKENVNVLKNTILKDSDLVQNIGTNVVEANSNINTVPIGIGIGAAGVTAAAAAVYVDSMNKKEKSKDEVVEEKIKTNDEDKYKLKEEEVITPYFANRDKTKTEKFYDD